MVRACKCWLDFCTKDRGKRQFIPNLVQDALYLIEELEPGLVFF